MYGGRAMADPLDQPFPEELRLAFLELLESTLLLLRGHARNADYCHALADHMHNVPALLARYSPDLLCFYWEVEVPCFIGALERIGEPPPPPFWEHWEVVETWHRALNGTDA
jgi:hypothetical protein